MKKSKEESAKTRKKIVATAAKLFRKKGISGIGLSDLMSAAGLTHGGFYRHFKTKDQLVAEAIEAAIVSHTGAMKATAEHAPSGHALEALMADYLSESHRDDPARGCVFACLANDLTHSEKAARAIATDGFSDTAALIARQLPDAASSAARGQALVILSAMIGALVMSRMVADPALSSELLRQARLRIGEMARQG